MQRYKQSYAELVEKLAAVEASAASDGGEGSCNQGANPHILIESKAYGATGSKQTDILGDIDHIVTQKRHDTTLLLVTDGSTWISRASDLRKLVEKQNQGFITRIYTVAMAGELREDLIIQLKSDHDLS